ncbi:MAG TPA: hypothetical protein VNF05_07080 [Acidimicrobiales bacterium]|nr:hypothetical protein [Acidimicrobiales bacterium]
MRKTFLMLALATLSVGIWTLVRSAPSNAACTTLASPVTGTGVSAQCSDLLSSYFLGYALIVGGLVTALLALVSMSKRKRRRGDYHREIQPIAQRRIHDANESQRRAA